MKKAISAVASLLITTTLLAQEITGKVDYPESYRDWTHVKSMVINKSHSLFDPFEGIHHIYANDKALNGLKSKTYKDGSTFVFDLLKAKRTDDAIVEGKRKFIGVMSYDAQKYSKTGGWGFEAYEGNSKDKRVVKDGGISCFECHKGVKKHSFVFSTYRK
jgi:hypothetical protein